MNSLPLQAIEVANEHLDWHHSTGRTGSDLCSALNTPIPFARREQAFAVLVCAWLRDRLGQP